MTFLCIDIGGTNTLIGVGDEAFDHIAEISTEAFLQDPTAHVAKQLETGQYCATVDTVAVAVAGPLNEETGVFYPPNIDVDEVQIIEPLRRFSNDFRVRNDCDAAVLGEYTYGGHDVEDLVYVTISTGIGAGIMIDGEILRGRQNAFGEVGHMIMGDKGVSCGCGGMDHWEAYCSGKHMPRMSNELFNAEFDDAREIFSAYRDGDATARKIIDLMQQHNKTAFSTIANAYAPEKIVIGGGVALNHADIILDGLEAAVAEHAIVTPPEITVSTLREHTVLHGLKAVCSAQKPGKPKAF